MTSSFIQGIHRAVVENCQVKDTLNPPARSGRAADRESCNANVTNSLLDLNQSLFWLQQPANVISTSNKMAGALLDVLA
jgi:hypothetical protein